MVAASMSVGVYVRTLSKQYDGVLAGYDRAVVGSIDPFTLVSEDGEKVWIGDWTAWFEVCGRADVQVMAKVNRRMSDRLDAAQMKRPNVCPKCHSTHWSRPFRPGGGADFTRRKCSVCGNVRWDDEDS